MDVSRGHGMLQATPNPHSELTLPPRASNVF